MGAGKLIIMNGRGYQLRKYYICPVCGSVMVEKYEVGFQSWSCDDCGHVTTKVPPQLIIQLPLYTHKHESIRGRILVRIDYDGAKHDSRNFSRVD